MNKKRIYPYIDNEVLIKEVSNIFFTVDQAINKIDKSMSKNVIDPFSALFDAYGQNINYEQWVTQEKFRQLQKTLQNAIGYFHQNILGSIGEWKSTGHGGGYDIENVKLKIFAEIKNKHNTFNSSSAAETYNKMVRYLSSTKKGNIGYVVIIIPKNVRRYTKPFAPGKLNKRNDLQEIDGASFYELVTGDKDALKKLFECLPTVIQKIKSLSDVQGSKEMDKFTALFNNAFGN